MSSPRQTGHEVRVGLVAVVALGGLIALLVLAGDGPGFLTSRQSIEVDFKDGQGVRPGSPVRIAGIDAGRVTDVTLAEVDGNLRARVTISVPVDLASKLKQDAKITIQASITGSARVNIVSSGKSTVALVPGQVIQGIESTFFDPILEQVGLGPVERNHLSHTIAEVRETVDKAGPRIRTILANVSDTTGGLKDTIEAVRPSIEGTAGHIEDVARRANAAAPKVEASLARVESLTTQVSGILNENRESIRNTLASVRDLTATANDMITRDRAKLEKILDGAEVTRARLDRVLYQADQIADQTSELIARNKTDIQRTVSNVRDATDWADKLVQKIFANPFVLSPFYKPTPEDIRVQAAYDSAQVFVKGAKELNDAVQTLEAMRARPQTAQNQAALVEIQRDINVITSKLSTTSQNLAESLKPSRSTRR